MENETLVAGFSMNIIFCSSNPPTSKNDTPKITCHTYVIVLLLLLTYSEQPDLRLLCRVIFSEITIIKNSSLAFNMYLLVRNTLGDVLNE
jgi:hypothetical protein